MLALATLRPFWAFLLVGAGNVFAAVVGELAKSRLSDGWASGIEIGVVGFFYCGWPVLIGLAIRRRIGSYDRKAGTLAAASLFSFVAIGLVAHPLLEFMDTDGQDIGAFGQVLVRFWVFIGLSSTLIYTLLFGAKAVVAGEEGCPPRARDCLGTLFLLLLGPVGLLFLQNRVRRVLLPLSSKLQGPMQTLEAQLARVPVSPPRVFPRSAGKWALTLHPIFAAIIIAGGIAAAELIGKLSELWVSGDVADGLSAGTYMAVYLGWPLLVGLVIRRCSGLQGNGLCWRAVAEFFCVVSFCPFFWHFVSKPGASVVYWLLMTGGAVIGLAAKVDILRFGAMSLVTAERKRPVRIDYYWGTFLLFYILPIGVLFLQKRLRKLLLPPETT